MTTVTERQARAPWAWLLLIFASFFVLYFQNHGSTKFQFWDESIYINASRAYINSFKPYPNPEHPLLGKQILAIGMRIFGDNPTGWRFFSILAGSLSVTVVSYLVWLLTKRKSVMAWVAVLMLADPLLFVHFRLGLLDPPLTLFFLLSATFACRYYLSPRPRRRDALLMAISLGLALSVKLLTLFIIPLALGLIFLRSRSLPRQEGISKKDWLLILGIIPLTVLGGYLIQGYTWKETWDLLVFNFSWHSTAKSWEPITSRWYEWLYIGNPIWYFVRPAGEGKFQAVLATGNLILWIGAELLAIYGLFRSRRRPEVIFLALILLAQFAVYFRKPHTYIHYMTEILPFIYVLMGVGIADLFHRYEDRYRRVLQIDFGLFALVSAVAFINYWPFILGRPITKEKLHSTPTYKNIPILPEPTPTPTPNPSPKPTPTPALKKVNS